MSVELGTYNGDSYLWGLSNNDYHRVYRGYTDYINIATTGIGATKILAIEANTAFQIYIESTATIDSQASGNNCYPPSTTLGYLNSKAIYENSSRVLVWGASSYITSSAVSSTYYLECITGESISSTSKGMGVYGVTTEAPTWQINKGGWYNSNGRVLASFEWSTVSSASTNLLLYSLSQQTSNVFQINESNRLLQTMNNGKTIWGNGIKYVTESTGYTLQKDDGISTIIVQSSGYQIPINIDTTSSTNANNNLYNRELEIKKDTLAGEVKILGGYFSDINIEGSTAIRLYSQYDSIILKRGSTEWYIKSGSKNINVDSGFIINELWNNRQYGSVNVTFDGESGTLQTGEKLICTSTSTTNVVAYGYTIYGTSTNTVILRDVVSTGSTSLFPNNYLLEGELGSYTATVNLSTSAKGVNTAFYHGFNMNMKNIDKTLLISTGGTENNSYELDFHTDAPNNQGLTYQQSSVNEFIVRGGQTGIRYIDNTGANIVLQTTAYNIFYNIKAKLK